MRNRKKESVLKKEGDLITPKGEFKIIKIFTEKTDFTEFKLN